MINLLAVSYNNIGPFKDKFLTIFFDQGKYLIKAPIGAGKSFLFFDGPIYGLYKYSSRSMLNTQCKSWFIKLLFEVEGQTYLIVRNLSKAKTKESCASTVYQVHQVESPSSQSRRPYRPDDLTTLQTDIDIQTELGKNPDIHIEEITFKNETDLQQTLQNILPPREVFLNTVFLMQDSDNIFELQPADRLTVLKNVFNLIWIDEAKDKIAERKKEIWYKLKATADTSKYDEKLKRLLADYMSGYKRLNEVCHSERNEEYGLAYPSLRSGWQAQIFFEELENIYEKVNIAEFSADDFPVKMHEDIDAKVDKNKSDYQKINHQLLTLVESHKVESHKVEGYQKEIKQLTVNSEQLTVKVLQIDPTKITKLKDEKKSLLKQQDTLEKEVKHELIKKFYAEHKNLFEDFKVNSDVIANAYLFVQHLKNTGKILNEEVKNIQLQIAHHNDTLKNHEEQLKVMNTKIKLFEQDVDQQAAYDCSKIGTNCPFIKVINKKTFEQLDKQKELLQKEKDVLEAKIKNLEETLHATSQQKVLKEILWDIEDIKLVLHDIDWKDIEKVYDEVQEIQAKEKSIDTQITNLEGETKKLEEYKLEIEKNKVQIENIEKSIQEAESEKLKAESEKAKIEEQVKGIDYAWILELEKLNTKMKESLRDITSLVHEFKDVQMQVKQLQQEEEIVSNLYNIFSKELLLLVLQDHLPVLSDIINSYLAQVVEYQINFSLNKTSTDKLELLAQIFDEKGERDVKSLSGGQRVILKIVWMLAISSYIHSPVLFIDETINNLDADTVAKVSDMLEDFVKSKSMKLYAVTHNQQIQDMKFWDKVIELEKNG